VTTLSVTARRIGNEGEPIVVIENFAADPDDLRAYASAANFTDAGDYYPGLRAPVPPAYLAQQRRLLATVFDEVFGVTRNIAVLDVAYSLVSAPPALLALEQRMPHVDALEPGRLALVHYLVPGGCDGTAFYRHRSTGFETIDAGRSGQYFAQLQDDLTAHGEPPAVYPYGSTAIFEPVAHFDGSYNRALVYRGRLLHSGAITDIDALSADPSTGRLTITGFFSAA
jgi:Family of unknown function (DUF6445)